MSEQPIDLDIEISTVMVATDFNHQSRLAVGYGAAFARHFQAQLITLNAFQFGPHSQNVELIEHVPSRERRDAERRLDDFAATLSAQGIAARSELVEGMVPDAILKAAASHKADLLVLGTENAHRGIAHLLLGSNTEALMLSAPCPTLTVGPRIDQVDRFDLAFKRILYISDLSSASSTAVPFVRALAHDLGTEIEVYHALPESVQRDPSRTRKLVENFEVNPAEAIQISSLDPSALVVLGVLPSGYLGRHMHTSLAYRIVTEAACPVLTVPASSSWLSKHLRARPQESAEPYTRS